MWIVSPPKLGFAPLYWRSEKKKTKWKSDFFIIGFGRNLLMGPRHFMRICEKCWIWEVFHQILRILILCQNSKFPDHYWAIVNGLELKKKKLQRTRTISQTVFSYLYSEPSRIYIPSKSGFHAWISTKSALYPLAWCLLFWGAHGIFDSIIMIEILFWKKWRSDFIFRACKLVRGA